MTSGQIGQRVRSGEWTRLANGAYRRNNSAAYRPGNSTGPGNADGNPLDHFAGLRRQHAERAAANALSNSRTVIAGFSATAVHDIPIISNLPERVCLVRQGSHGARRRSADIRSWALAPDEIQLSRPPVTTLARTWFDVARLGTLADALSTGDYLLRELLISPEDLAIGVARARAPRGIRQATRALEHITRLRESPLESASWAYFLRYDIPLPRMQVTIRTADGRFIGRVDFLWEEARLIGECDGMVKYDDRKANFAEKLREDELRAEDYRVARWGLQHLRTDALARRLHRLLG